MDEKLFPKIGTQNLKTQVYELLLDLIGLPGDGR